MSRDEIGLAAPLRRLHTATPAKNGAANAMRSASSVTGSCDHAYASLIRIGRNEKHSTPPIASSKPMVQ
jgi:hypothetical protein